MRKIIVSLNLVLLLMAVSCPAMDYYVNGGTGVDSATCGSPADPCKTIKKTLEVVHEGLTTIRISRGAYLEKDMLLPASANIKNDITLEGGWNADFTLQSCDSTNTVILADNTTNPAFNELFRAFTAGNEAAAYTLRCLTIDNNASGTLTRALEMVAEEQGQIELTVEQVRVTGFPNLVFYFSSRNDSTFSTSVNHLTLDHNIIDNSSNSSIVVQASGNSTSHFTMKNSILQHNGSASSATTALYLWTQGQGELVAQLENTIISDNIGTGIELQSNGPNPFTLTLVNNTIANNTCNTCDSAGMNVHAYDSSQPDIIMRNTILRGNHNAQQNRDLYLFEQSGANITFSALYNIMGVYDYSGTPDYTSSHELHLDPHLDGNYHLTSASPAINAGQCGFNAITYIRVAPYDDIDGDLRPGYGALTGCDIGVDEYIPFPWPMFLPAITHQ